MPDLTESLASMVNFDGSYEVTARRVGKETVTRPDDSAVEIFLLDVGWHHRESGDNYPPGPDGSGGRYWPVPDPPPGMPYVLRY
jgi:hypothetical protein